MKKLLLLLGVLLFFPAASHAVTPPFVQGTFCQNTGISTCSFPGTTTAGNLVAVGVWMNGTTVTITGVTDPHGAACSLGQGPTDLSTFARQYLWYCPNQIAGTSAITITASGSLAAVFVVIWGAEFSGLVTTSPLDGTGAGASAFGGDPQSSGTWAATRGDLILGQVTFSNTGSPAFGPGFVSDPSVTDAGHKFLEWKTLTTTTGEATSTGTNTAYEINGITLKQQIGLTPTTSPWQTFGPSWAIALVPILAALPKFLFYVLAVMVMLSVLAANWEVTRNLISKVRSRKSPRMEKLDAEIGDRIQAAQQEEKQRRVLRKL